MKERHEGNKLLEEYLAHEVEPICLVLQTRRLLRSVLSSTFQAVGPYRAILQRRFDIAVVLVVAKIVNLTPDRAEEGGRMPAK